MDADYHFYATYLAARAVGYPRSAAKTIASASAFVDHFNISKAREFRNKAEEFGVDTPGRFTFPSEDDNWFNDKLNKRWQNSVWTVYHFVPGNKPTGNDGPGYKSLNVERAGSLDEGGLEAGEGLSRPLSGVILTVMKTVLKSPDDLHLVGVATHVFEDTWAHQNFSGRALQMNVKNGSRDVLVSRQKDQWESLGLSPFGGATQQAPYVGTGIPGHARFGVAPDLAFAKWFYDPYWSTNPCVQNNPEIFMEAWEHVVYFLTAVREGKDLDDLLQNKPSLNGPYRDAVQRFIDTDMLEEWRASPSFDDFQGQCMKKWREVSGDLVDGETYTAREDWPTAGLAATDAASFKDTDLYKYDQAALAFWKAMWKSLRENGYSHTVDHFSTEVNRVLAEDCVEIADPNTKKTNRLPVVPLLIGMLIGITGMILGKTQVYNWLTSQTPAAGETALNTRIWITDSDSKQYTFPEQLLPEIQAKENIAICFSGGGARAMTAAMGQLRALHNLGSLPKIRYISCVSGGSWASTIYTYYKNGPNGQIDDEALLGKRREAEDIDREYLNGGPDPNCLAFRANVDLVLGWTGVMAWAMPGQGDYTRDNAWIFAVGQTYLEPFGIFNTSHAQSYPHRFKYFSYDDETVEGIIARNPHLRAEQFLTVNPDRPFLVVNSCIVPRAGAEASELISFEYTPLTIGRPYRYPPKSPDQAEPARYFGGGFIEPFAFRTDAPTIFTAGDGKSEMGESGWVTVSGQDRPHSVADATGTSSSAHAQDVPKRTGITSLNPQCKYWPIDARLADPAAKLAPSAELTLFGDGGLTDNYGLIPMIQRGVENIIVFINTDTKLDVDYEPNSDIGDEANDPEGRCDQCLPALFGYNHDEWPYQYPNNRVFPAEDLKVILDALKRRKDAGQPLIVTTSHITVSNADWGVKAGKPIKITWCYLERSRNWEEKLPDNIQVQIENGNDPQSEDWVREFVNFPNYDTFRQNSLGGGLYLTKKQILLLADFACEVILTDDQQTIQRALGLEIGEVPVKEPLSDEEVAQRFFNAYLEGDRNAALKVAEAKAVDRLTWDGGNPTLRREGAFISFEGGGINLVIDRDGHVGSRITDVTIVSY